MTVKCIEDFSKHSVFTVGKEYEVLAGSMVRADNNTGFFLFKVTDALEKEDSTLLIMATDGLVAEFEEVTNEA